MKKMVNEVHCEGYLYEHDLALKVSGPTSKKPGTEFISGTISIATDEACTNIVEFHYTYVTAVTSTGKQNFNFARLKDIIDGNTKTVMADGKENAAKVQISSAIGLNDFYTEQNGNWNLVSTKRNEGGFIRIIGEVNDSKRNYFKTDMVITKAVRLEENEERGLPERMTLSGVCFDFRGSILPVEFTMYLKQGMDYFEGQEISGNNPLCTEVRGEIVNTTVIKREVEESAFGEPVIRETPTTKREYVATSCSLNPFEWDSDEFITAEELKKLVADRETYLAEVKQRAIEWKEQRAIQNVTPATSAAKPAASNGGFNF